MNISQAVGDTVAAAMASTRPFHQMFRDCQSVAQTVAPVTICLALILNHKKGFFVLFRVVGGEEREGIKYQFDVKT